MSLYQLDAYAANERAREEMTSFVRSSFRFRDSAIDGAVHDAIAEFGLVAPPVVEATFPFELPSAGPKTTGELASAGVLHRDLPALLDAARGEARWPTHRPLYRHQVEAIQSYREGKSLVVASGTGSGKTECFLFPALDKLLRDKDLERPGVRVLIIYPLNALVNNQMERLRAILGDHPAIRFSLYTRRLAETTKEAERKIKRLGLAMPRAELISREQIRDRPPHILVTNYSMLEYALVRPADASIFGEQFAQPEMVVIDEAHVYAGAMAAELTLLMRRAWLRWGIVEPGAVQGIATSATMTQGISDGRERLRTFAASLLSKAPSDVVPIEGRRVIPKSKTAVVEVAPPGYGAAAALVTDFATLVEDVVDGEFEVKLDGSGISRERAKQVIDVLRPGFRPSCDDLPAARLLHEALEPLAWVRKLRGDLNQAATRIDRLADVLFGPEGDTRERVRATHRVLEVLALARDVAGEIPLLPVRIHATARGPHGVYACLNGQCSEAVIPGTLGKLYTEPVGRCGCGCGVYELRVCDACGQSFLLGFEGTDDDGLPALVPQRVRGRQVGAGSRKKKEDVALYCLRDRWDDGGVFPTATGEAPKELRVDTGSAPCRVGAPDGRLLWRFPGGKLKGPERALAGVACPRCHTHRPALLVIRRVEAGTDAALLVLIHGVYPSLPRHHAAADHWLRGQGRRLLLFADNRQVAASLAAKVEESHDTQLARRILVEALDACAGRGESPRVAAINGEILAAVARADFKEAARLNERLAEARAVAAAEGVDFERLASAIRNHSHIQELSNHDAASALDLARMVVARELSRRPARLGNLEANGVVVVDYGMSFPAPKHPDVRGLFPDDSWDALVATLLDMLRTDGVCSVLNVGKHDDFLPRRFIGRPMVKEERKAKAGAHAADDSELDARWEKKPVPLLPAGAGVTANDSRRLDYVERVLVALAAPSAVTPVLVLEEVWDALERAAPTGQRQSESTSPIRRRDEAGRLEIVFHMLRFRRSTAGPLYRCPLCRTSWAHHVASVCPTNHCGGTLAHVAKGEELDWRDRIVARAVGERATALLGLSSEEHTAQIEPEDLEESEARFKRGELNVLVCSTTMELGIDIGGLSATLLTNVPPGPSNYLQRAGRAGRRAEGTALVMTFARPRPFDQAAFAEPERPFKLPIQPPDVKLDSPRICRRHVHAYLLARFFERFEAGVSTRSPLAVLGTVKSFFEDAIAAVEHLDVTVVNEIEKTLGLDVKRETMCHAFIEWLVDTALADTTLVSEVRALTKDTVLEAMSVDDIADRCWTHIDKIATEVRHQLRFLQQQLNDEQAKPEAKRDRGMVRAIELQRDDLAREALLSYLAVEQFLPRYGFPVQVVPLVDRYDDRRAENRPLAMPRLRLERDVALALNEYAPGAEVVAGKHVHVSRGLLRHWTGTDASGIIAQRVIGLCPNCGQFHYARNQGGLEKRCRTCQQEGLREIRVVEPKLGFAVQWGRPPQRWAGGTTTALRPVTEAVYATREGGPAVDVSPALALAYDEEGTILVRSEGSLMESDPSRASSDAVGAQRQGYGYAICYLCGRAEPETEEPTIDKRGNKVDLLPKALDGHQRLRGKGRCECKGNYWRHMVLAGDLRTETLRVELTGALALPGGEDGLRLSTTWMVALQLAAGEVLGVDSREVGGLLSPRGVGQTFVYDVILYDQVAGGVGHCRALLARWQDLMRAARQRLSCSNPACTTACHRCLLAFETQRYEPLLRRRTLLARLDPGWALLEQRAERDGLPVEPMFRGGVEVQERLAALPTADLTLVAPAVGLQAMVDDGWLRWILRFADGPGRARLVLGRVPDPNADEDRIAALRLRLAIEMGKVEVWKVSPSAAADFPWKLSSSAADAEDVFLVEDANDGDALGPTWLREKCRVSRAAGHAAAQAARERVALLVSGARACVASDFEPDEVAPSVVVHNVPALRHGADATLARWFVNSAGEPLNDRPLRVVRIVDPYLQTDWQIKLLEEAAAFFRTCGCKRLEVETYGPVPEKENQGHGPHRTLTAAEQQSRIAHVVGSAGWTPLAPTTDPFARVHQRTITGTREDGSRFVVLLERGLDFITLDKRRGVRTTRESYVVVKEE